MTRPYRLIDERTLVTMSGESLMVGCISLVVGLVMLSSFSLLMFAIGMLNLPIAVLAAALVAYGAVKLREHVLIEGELNEREHS